MYISAWEDFITAARALYLEDPQHTRYCIKYRTKQGQLELKVTDDRVCVVLASLSSWQCIKWRTDKREDLRKMEEINGLFFKLMTSKNPASVSVGDLGDAS